MDDLIVDSEEALALLSLKKISIKFSIHTSLIFKEQTNDKMHILQSLRQKALLSTMNGLRLSKS
jgi:hypothetical protein